MHPREFFLMRELIRERLGLVLSQDGSRQLGRRLRERLEALRLPSVTEYHRFLRYHPDGEDEVSNLFDLATNNETYFFREEHQLEAFARDVLPTLAGPSSRHLTCWSIGCSTGEEAYSIAVMVLESGLFDDYTARVYGTDISRRCVATARRAVYGDSSFRNTKYERRVRYFAPVEEGARVVDAVRSMCTFAQMNIMEMRDHSTIDQVDAVFCRNVLIYFDPALRPRILDDIYDKLRPGGYLMLGHSESLLNEPGRFEVVQTRHDIVYRRPLLPYMNGGDQGGRFR